MQEEISKHTKKIYKTMKGNDHTLKEKIIEIVIEIFIIVFAVSLSIWLHGWSEHRHQQKEVKEFLIDLKDDLKNDSINYNRSLKAAQKNIKDYYFLFRLTSSGIDSLKKAKGQVTFNSTFSTTKISSGNYEGFKSSGKIGYIENKKLKSSILQYYQELTTSLLELEKYQTQSFQRVLDFVDENANRNITEIIMMPSFKQKLNYHSQNTEGLIMGYEEALKKINDILIEIEKGRNE
jgi:hypothetical protein